MTDQKLSANDVLKRESSSTFFERRKDYIYLRYKSYSKVGIEEAREHARIIEELCPDCAMPFILDSLNTEANFTHQAREFFSTYEPLIKRRKASAFLINTLPNRLLFKFYLKFHKPQGAIRVFDNLHDAEHWIRQFPPEKIIPG